MKEFLNKIIRQEKLELVEPSENVSALGDLSIDGEACLSWNGEPSGNLRVTENGLQKIKVVGNTLKSIEIY